MKKNKRQIDNVNKTQTIEKHYNFVDKREYHITIENLNLLADELTDWAKAEPNALNLSQFCNSRGIWKGDLYRWADKLPRLHKAIQMAHQIIGHNKETKCFKGECPPVLVMPYMAMHDHEYKMYSEWRASLKNKEEQKAQHITVVMEQFPEIKKDE